VNVVIDAQRGEFYLASHEFSTGDAKEMAPLQIVSLPTVESRAGAGVTLIGPEVTRWVCCGEHPVS